MDHRAHLDENALIAGETRPAPMVGADDLSWAVVKMHAVERIVVNEALIAAYQAASSPHSIRALKSDLDAFDLWCRRHNRISLPATPETVADYLDARAEKGSKPASLGRYKASIAKIHMLLDLKDPTRDPLVKLRRTDGRPVSRFFAEEVVSKVGIDAFMGLPAKEEYRAATMVSAMDPNSLSFDSPNPAALAASAVKGSSLWGQIRRKVVRMVYPQGAARQMPATSPSCTPISSAATSRV